MSKHTLGLLETAQQVLDYLEEDDPPIGTCAEILSLAIEKDRQLIAAAPDLLEAARYLLDHHAGDMTPKWRNLEAAIKKATL